MVPPVSGFLGRLRRASAPPRPPIARSPEKYLRAGTSVRVALPPAGVAASPGGSSPAASDEVTLVEGSRESNTFTGSLGGGSFLETYETAPATADVPLESYEIDQEEEG